MLKMTIEKTADEIKKKLEELNNVEVKIALFGQPGAGKSSLINALIGKKAVETGVRTDTTVEMSCHSHNGTKLCDLPGYGTEKFPADGYYERFQLDTMDLFLCVISGKLHKADKDLFNKLATKGKICIFVSNQSDTLFDDEKTVEELKVEIKNDIGKQLNKSVDVIFTSCRDKSGLDDLSKTILLHLDKSKRDRWLRSAQARSTELLEKKRNALEDYVYYAAGAAAANAINPVPGVDVAVDVTILVTLFTQIREDYGFDDEKLKHLKSSNINMVVNLTNQVIKYSLSDGVMLLLKRYATTEVTKTITKYIPFVGQAIAATAGFWLTKTVGMSYLEDCHKLAEELLREELQQRA